MGEERFLVTGSSGCIGAWVVHLLNDSGVPVIGLDVADDVHRLALLMSDRDIDGLTLWKGDITDPASVAGVVAEERITHIVHLAALQVPFCKADPVRGAQVNVVGTINVLEAARHSGGQVRGITYASSIAVFGPPELYPNGTAGDDSPLHPATLYGAYKQANEYTAKVYAEDYGVSSVGLRPSIVYGPGRDQGLTSDPTKAMVAAAAAAGPFHIGFGGRSVFQHAEDVAQAFIAAARADVRGAPVLNLGGPSLEVAEVVAAIVRAAPQAEGTITHDDQPLPFPRAIDGSGLDQLLGGVHHRPFDEGAEHTIRDFEKLLARGLVSADA